MKPTILPKKMQQSLIGKKTMKSCKTFELGFSRFVEIKKSWTIGEGKGRKISKIVGHTHKHTCKTTWMEGNTCTLKGTQRDNCFIVHMLTNTNPKYQKTFGGSERKFRNKKNPTMHSSFSL